MTIETDHQPLVTITKRPIHSTPARLQRMLLQLQRYNITQVYKKGKHMYRHLVTGPTSICFRGGNLQALPDPIRKQILIYIFSPINYSAVQIQLFIVSMLFVYSWNLCISTAILIVGVHCKK